MGARFERAELPSAAHTIYSYIPRLSELDTVVLGTYSDLASKLSVNVLSFSICRMFSRNA